MPGIRPSLRASYILVPIAILFTLPVVATGKIGNLPLLLPLWALTAYGAFRADRIIGLRKLVLIQIALGLLIFGMLLGPWQDEPALNRVGHGLAAFALSFIICSELRPYGPLWLSCLAGFGLAVSLGVSMEIAEALAGAGDVILATRWQDTIADLGANLVGSALAASVWFVHARRSPGTDQT